ncbi:MAG: hydantoinase/oxoprolinase family protein, partial [Firmicutes bacterium]|nr:hydantoinase/oxoprolinase family protein [Bacillota bacterium]
MLVGIDVGGTFTDGVLYHEGKIIKTAKYPTATEKLQDSILQVFDDLLAGVNEQEIERVVLSTTLVTNLLAAGKEEKVALVLIPGPGLNLRQLPLFPATYILKGAIDFRGRITEPLVHAEVEEVAAQIKAQGFKQAAVVGKFSSRNHEHEEQVAQILQTKIPHLQIVKGHEVSGQLNFLRRMVTAYYTAATKNQWAGFAQEIESAIKKRGIHCPLHILKADGGTMPLPVSLKFPCETVFSGPAASVMGAFALTGDNLTSVVVDIGGTTSDLALILAGEPLHASRGARINGRYSSVRAFAVRSLALGGDSAVRWTGKEITLGPDRLGPAACF